jgi:hypothetical protein
MVGGFVWAKDGIFIVDSPPSPPTPLHPRRGGKGGQQPYLALCFEGISTNRLGLFAVVVLIGCGFCLQLSVAHRVKYVDATNQNRPVGLSRGTSWVQRVGHIRLLAPSSARRGV